MHEASKSTKHFSRSPMREGGREIDQNERETEIRAPPGASHRPWSEQAGLAAGTRLLNRGRLGARNLHRDLEHAALAVLQVHHPGNAHHLKERAGWHEHLLLHWKLRDVAELHR